MMHSNPEQNNTMETFAWDQNFLTGLESVDSQHRELVDLFNELNISLFSNTTDKEDIVAQAFEKVVDYTNYHFAEEEEMMVLRGVDPIHIEYHKTLHEQFVQQIKTLWTQRKLISKNPEMFIGFLTSWLGMHILGVDQSLSRQIKRIQEGMSATQARELESTAHDNSTQALLKMINRLYKVLSTQNAELALANTRLEDRVRQRTEELAQSNAELTQANTQLEAFSRTDGLLKIANRGYFDTRLQQACRESAREEQPLGLLMIDVDFFKRYNDTYGHQAGDECLKAVAQSVRDTVIRHTDLVARYGGEELAVILPNTDLEGVRATATRIINAVRGLNLPHSQSDAAPYVTVSVGGVSRIAGPHIGSDALIALADAALYRAKATGRNRYELDLPA